MRIFPLPVLAIAAALFSFTSVQVEASPKTFEQWCQQKNSLSPATKNTIEVLLKESATQDCKAASNKLTSLSGLSLGGKGITDLAPLSALTNLTSLNLYENQIIDVKPLSALTNLTSLSSVRR